MSRSDPALESGACYRSLCKRAGSCREPLGRAARQREEDVGKGGAGGGRTDEELDVGRVCPLQLHTVAQESSTATACDQAGVRAALDEAENAAQRDEAARDELWQCEGQLWGW